MMKRNRSNPPVEIKSDVMTLQDLAEYLNCHYGTAFRLARRGDFPGFGSVAAGGS
jgi:hypothetical protein